MLSFSFHFLCLYSLPSASSYYSFYFLLFVFFINAFYTPHSLSFILPSLLPQFPPALLPNIRSHISPLYVSPFTLFTVILLLPSFPFRLPSFHRTLSFPPFLTIYFSLPPSLIVISLLPLTHSLSLLIFSLSSLPFPLFTFSFPWSFIQERAGRASLETYSIKFHTNWTRQR